MARLKFSEDQCKEIRKRYNDNVTFKEIQKEFGATFNTIYKVVHRLDGYGTETPSRRTPVAL